MKTCLCEGEKEMKTFSDAGRDVRQMFLDCGDEMQHQECCLKDYN